MGWAARDINTHEVAGLSPGGTGNKKAALLRESPQPPARGGRGRGEKASRLWRPPFGRKTRRGAAINELQKIRRASTKIRRRLYDVGGDK